MCSYVEACYITEKNEFITDIYPTLKSATVPNHDLQVGCFLGTNGIPPWCKNLTAAGKASKQIGNLHKRTPIKSQPSALIVVHVLVTTVPWSISYIYFYVRPPTIQLFLPAPPDILCFPRLG